MSFLSFEIESMSPKILLIVSLVLFKFQTKLKFADDFMKRSLMK